MLTRFINSAMEQATYEILDDATYYGEIPSCRGVWANARTLEACRRELQEVLEEWLELRLRADEPLPKRPRRRGSAGGLSGAQAHCR